MLPFPCPTGSVLQGRATDAAPEGTAPGGLLRRCGFVLRGLCVGPTWGPGSLACTADQLVERCVVAARHAHEVRKDPDASQRASRRTDHAEHSWCLRPHHTAFRWRLPLVGVTECVSLIAPVQLHVQNWSVSHAGGSQPTLRLPFAAPDKQNLGQVGGLGPRLTQTEERFFGPGSAR
jgi:hypothetical protein